MIFDIILPCDLKECPFCKEKPALIIEDIYDYNGNHNYYIKCSNKDCKIKPETYKYSDIYYDKKEAINKACNDWNYRKDGDKNEKK